MPETITLHALDLSGETTLKLFLRKDDGTLLNTGGDDLAEIGSSGVFTATLAESRSGLGDLSYRICLATETADNLLIDGFLPETETTIGASGTAVLDSTTRVKLDAMQPDYAPATAANLTLAKAILDKIDTGLVLDGVVYQFTANMLELGPSGGGGGSSDWTADERTAIRSILGIPGSGTTPANPTTGILDTIRDLVVAYIAAALATVDGSSGTIVDFPTSLNIGDSYTDEANASIHVFIRDASDDPITAVGSFNFTDPEFAPEVNITQSGSTGRVKAVVTFVEASPEDYLKVEIPSSQSRRASPGTATVQCLLKWVDTDGKVLCQKTLSKQAVTWNEMV